MCLISLESWELGNSLPEVGLHQDVCPPGLIARATDTDTDIPSLITSQEDVDPDSKDYRITRNVGRGKGSSYLTYHCGSGGVIT